MTVLKGESPKILKRPINLLEGWEVTDLVHVG